MILIPQVKCEENGNQEVYLGAGLILNRELYLGILSLEKKTNLFKNT
jgi:hypothetical protein